MSIISQYTGRNEGLECIERDYSLLGYNLLGSRETLTSTDLMPTWREMYFWEKAPPLP